MALGKKQGSVGCLARQSVERPVWKRKLVRESVGHSVRQNVEWLARQSVGSSARQCQKIYDILCWKTCKAERLKTSEAQCWKQGRAVCGKPSEADSWKSTEA